jgi:mono/diheme cytochrome c family protein
MTRWKLGVAGTALVLVVAGALVASGAFAAPRAPVHRTAVSATSLTVVTGKPIEYAMKISRTAVRPGPVVITVQNKGLLHYIFEICSRGGNADVCEGTQTITLNPGQSAKLTANLKKGPHEFILRADHYVTMKGLLDVTPNAAVGKTTTAPGGKTTKPKPGATTTPSSPSASGGKGSQPSSKPGGTSPKPGGGTSPSPSQPSGTPPAGGATLIGDPAAGAGVFKSAGCGTCHTLSAAGTNGTAGPNLDQVSPDQQTVVTNVTYGNALGMPAFGGPGGSLSAAQINNVAAYVYSSTHSTAH